MHFTAATLTHRWDLRMRRAQQLADEYPFAREILIFYNQIARFQRELAGRLEALVASGNRSLPLREVMNLGHVLPHFPEFLELVSRTAPRPLAARAQELLCGSRGVPDGVGSPEAQRDLPPSRSAEYHALLAAYREDGGRHEPLVIPAANHSHSTDPSNLFCARAFIEPYAELLAAQRIIPPPVSRHMACPLCASRPQFAVLRPEGDGAKRFLACSFCGTEWEFVRIICPACGEEDEKKQCVYAAEQSFARPARPASPEPSAPVRVEACDSCKSYLLSIDLTKCGHAVPVVDELAALPLGLWAGQNGYTKIHPNLLGL